MIDAKAVNKQLKSIRFGHAVWNQPEIKELPHILHENETILECVNGFYEGGVALLVATDMRVLLVDKKPLNFLTVEDLRFDMINEIDYAHRLLGATITISTGNKKLRYSSLNQARLRKLITLLQERMSLIKREQTNQADTQQQHLEEINRQLQIYLLAQHQQLQQQMAGQQVTPIELPKPSAELSDFLLAQRLLDDYKQGKPATAAQPERQRRPPAAKEQPKPKVAYTSRATVGVPDLAAAAKKEIFSRAALHMVPPAQPGGREVNLFKIAYARLPMLLRSKKAGEPLPEAPALPPAMLAATR